MMIEFQLTDVVSLLSKTPRTLRAMLEPLPDPWIANNYGEKTFSPFDVVGHLIHGERTDWIPRARIILSNGADQPFEPFDRYAMYERTAGRSIAELLETFEGLRTQNIAALKEMKLTDQQLELKGTHPELGQVNLRALIATWVVHDLNHIAQIAKGLAYQYTDSVGAWKPYISILR